MENVSLGLFDLSSRLIDDDGYYMIIYLYISLLYYFKVSRD